MDLIKYIVLRYLGSKSENIKLLQLILFNNVCIFQLNS